MKLPTYVAVALFTVSLVLMGASGYPLEDVKLAGASPFVVTGLRLAVIGIIALAFGAFWAFFSREKVALSLKFVKEWLSFAFVAVVCVNGALTIAIYILDNRLAMAVMFLGLGYSFVVHHPFKPSAWGAAILAFLAVCLLGASNFDFTDQSQGEKLLFGFLCAFVAGQAQGVIFFGKRALPKTGNPCLLLGAAFLLGGILFLGGVWLFIPQAIEVLEQSHITLAIALSAAMVAPCWLVLVHMGRLMTHGQKTGSAACEPIGATLAEYANKGTPALHEWAGIAMLICSALMAMGVPRAKAEKQSDDDLASKQ